jgi:hypothetical protein
MVPEPLSSLLLAAAVVSSTGITCHLDAYKCHKPTSPDQSNPNEEALQVVLFVERRAVLLYWSNPVSQVLRAMAFKQTTRGRSNFGELMTVKIS